MNEWKIDKQVFSQQLQCLQDVIFAYGSTDSLPPGGHGPCCRGKGKVNLMSGGTGGGGGEPTETGGEIKETESSVKPNRRLIIAHAWIQTVSWAILAVMGLVMSRLARHWKYWRHLHIGFEVSATVLSFVGQMVAFGYSQVGIIFACITSVAGVSSACDSMLHVGNCHLLGQVSARISTGTCGLSLFAPVS